MALKRCLGIGRTDCIRVLYEGLPAVVLLKDGDLLHSSVGREDGVERVDCHRIHLVLNLHVASKTW